MGWHYATARKVPKCGGRTPLTVEAGIGIGLKDAGISLKMPFGLLAATVARVEEHRGRRIATAERTIIPDIRPQPPGCRVKFSNTGTGVSSPCTR